MSFFAVPLSGLVASQQQLQAVSTNLANLDTVGYKDQNVSFADLFAASSAQNGAGDPVQIGVGTESSATTSDFTSGNLSPTNVPSNMALQGNGFFVVQAPNGSTSYERAGNFTSNTNGELVDPSGNVALGYPAVNGVVNTSAALQPLNVGGGTGVAATATTSFTIPTNLNANAAVGTTSAWTSNAPLHDSLGNPVALDVTFTKTAANTWSYSATIPTSLLPATTPPATSPTTVVGSGSLVFDSSGVLAGTLDSSGVATTPAISNPVIDIPALADGSATMSAVTWDLASSSGAATMSQNNLASQINSAATQNGNGAGTLSSYSISTDGTIEALYSNGSTQSIGQVALANFANTQGLEQLGNNLYQSTAASGQAQIGVGGTGGLGTITGGSIEESNVDTAAEFGKMIVAQQAYQANAKTITTLDQVSQATLEMITS
jgi:flagellar hook protein FlgE